jgi:hypothetical protein
MKSWSESWIIPFNAANVDFVKVVGRGGELHWFFERMHFYAR